jgi:hypothetical protein
LFLHSDDTTPEEEPEKKKSLGDTDSSDTDEEDKALERPHKKGPKFTSMPEIIPEIGASGSAATTTSDTPSEAPIKKPLKSALKKPRAGSYNVTPVPESSLSKPEEDSPEKDDDKSPERYIIQIRMRGSTAYSTMSLFETSACYLFFLVFFS